MQIKITRDQPDPFATGPGAIQCLFKFSEGHGPRIILLMR
jgi:hypothetical protein